MEGFMFLGLNEVEWTAVIGGIVTIANVITSATESKKDNKVYNTIMKVFNVLSLNIGHNKNADDL